MGKKVSDAEATIRAQILNGMVVNADRTGLVAHNLEKIVLDVFCEVFLEPSTRWAVAQFVKESEPDDEKG